MRPHGLRPCARSCSTAAALPRVELQHDVGDAFGVIAHAFQLAGDVHRGDQAAQIAGYRLLPDDGDQAGIFQLITPGVDDLDRFRSPSRARRSIVIEQRRNRAIDGRVDAIAQTAADQSRMALQFPIEFGAWTQRGSDGQSCRRCNGCPGKRVTCAALDRQRWQLNPLLAQPGPDALIDQIAHFAKLGQLFVSRCLQRPPDLQTASAGAAC